MTGFRGGVSGEWCRSWSRAGGLTVASECGPEGWYVGTRWVDLLPWGVGVIAVGWRPDFGRPDVSYAAAAVARSGARLAVWPVQDGEPERLWVDSLREGRPRAMGIGLRPGEMAVVDLPEDPEAEAVLVKALPAAV